MTLSAPDIRNRSFSQSLRGLDEEEVQAFLDEVADRWDEMQRRVQTLQGKLEEIGDTAGKARTAKERAEERERAVAAKEERLDEREQALEEKRAKVDQQEEQLRAVAQRLRDTLREEQETLTALSGGDGSVSREATGRSSGASQESQATDHEPASDDEKSTEEWVDSLFPNRLPGDSAPASETGAPDASEEEKTEPSAGESQFQAIKQDVQGMEEESAQSVSSSSSSSEVEEDESPPTDEMERIWDVFDETGRT